MAHFMFWMSSFILKLHQIQWSSTTGGVSLMYSLRLHARLSRAEWRQILHWQSCLRGIQTCNDQLRLPWWDTTVPTGKKRTLTVRLVKVNSAQGGCGIGSLGKEVFYFRVIKRSARVFCLIYLVSFIIFLILAHSCRNASDVLILQCWE